MKQLKMVLLGLLAVLCLSSISLAQGPGPYAGGFLGIFIPHDSDVTDPVGVTGTFVWETGLGIGGVLGYRLPNNLRFEGELSHRVADLDKVKVFGSSFSSSGEVEATSLMVNGYYDIPLQNSTFVPYVGIGLGVTSVDIKWQGSSEDDSVITFQLALGGALPLSNSLDLDMSYRLFLAEDAGLNGWEAEVTHSNLQVGLLYRF